MTTFPHFTHYPGDPLANRDLWQRHAWPSGRLRDLSVTVLGLNGIGRAAALMVAALGVPRIELVDPGTVYPQHLNAEGYLEYDLATAKCDAVAAACVRLNSRLHVRPSMRDPADHAPDTLVCEAVLCCVQDPAVRRHIRDVLRGSSGACRFFAAAHARGEDVRVWAGRNDSDEEGFDNAFGRTESEADDADPHPGLIHTATVAAGLMVAQLGCHVRGNPPPGMLGLNLTHGG